MDEYHDPAAGKYGLSYPLSDPYYYRAWVDAFGGYFYDAETESLGLTDSATIDAIELVVETLAPYTAAEPPSPLEETAFAKGNAPFAIHRPAHVATAEPLDEPTETVVGTTSLPAVDGNTPTPFTTVEAFYFTERLTDDHEAVVKPAATGFAQWYATTVPELLANVRDNALVPASIDAIQHSDFPSSLRPAVDAAVSGTLEPPAPKMDVIYPHVQAAFGAVLQEEQSATTALEDAEETIRDELSGVG